MSIQGFKQASSAILNNPDRFHYSAQDGSAIEASVHCTVGWQRAFEEGCAQVERFSAEIMASTVRFRQLTNFGC